MKSSKTAYLVQLFAFNQTKVIEDLNTFLE